MRRGTIRVQNISKRYNLQNGRSQYRTLRDTLSDSISAPIRSIRNRGSGNASAVHWALKDVSFEVAPGQVAGIVGRNGAGKSTLLKILSRITEPTSGRAETCGRVASLLEVGTGFHVELSGRENIYLNGAILGMPRREIDRKFDDIVGFAEVEKFVDTPVKRYSSGMYLRLAFAVSAHLEPEILVVDEVLAVGDAEFQKKCLGKMEDVARDGRTVLFVSHNMAAVRMLCSRGVLLNQGEVVFDGPIQEVTQQYLSVGQERSGERVWANISSAPGDDVVRLHSVRTMNSDGKVTGELSIHDSVSVAIEYWVLKPGYPLDTLCYFVDEYGATRFLSLDNHDSPWKDSTRPPGLHRCTCNVPGDFFTEGTVRIHALVNSSGTNLHACEHDALAFKIVDDMDPRGVRGNYPQAWPEAAVRPRLNWTVERVEDIERDLASV